MKEEEKDEKLSVNSVDAELEKIRAENERLLEESRKMEELQKERQKNRELMAKISPATSETNPYGIDMSKQVELEFIPPSKAKRYDSTQFPDDDGEIREIVRKHALKQLESSRRNTKWILDRIEAYAKESVGLVKSGKARSGQAEFAAKGYGIRNSSYATFDRHAQRIKEECGVIGIAPIFSEVEAINI